MKFKKTAWQFLLVVVAGAFAAQAETLSSAARSPVSLPLDPRKPPVNHSLPRARLAVLPGTDHMTLVNRADWQVSMIEEFLDASMP